MTPMINPPNQGGKSNRQRWCQGLNSPYKYKALTLIEIPLPGQSPGGLQYYHFFLLSIQGYKNETKIGSGITPEKLANKKEPRSLALNSKLIHNGRSSINQRYLQDQSSIMSEAAWGDRLQLSSTILPQGRARERFLVVSYYIKYEGLRVV